MSIEHTMNELGKAIQRAQDDAEELGCIRATLLYNFGPQSRSLELYGFRIEESPRIDAAADDATPTSELVEWVLTRFVEMIQNNAKPILCSHCKCVANPPLRCPTCDCYICSECFDKLGSIPEKTNAR